MRRRDERGRILPNTRMVKGKQERQCSGPSHNEPTWLPDSDKYFYTRKSGRYAGYRVSVCRLCSAWKAGLALDESGMIPAAKIKPFLLEGRNKVGTMEFCRRANIVQRQVWGILNNKQKWVSRAVAKRILLEVVSIRRKGEVRHKDSIFHGSIVRGVAEKKVERPEDLYEPLSEEQRNEEEQRKVDKAKRKREERAAWSSAKRAEVARKQKARRVKRMSPV